MTHPDTAARAHVEGTWNTMDLEIAAETFGPLHHYGIHEPVVIGDNDNRPAGIALHYESATRDRGPYITTHRGRFYPFSPRASEVDIYDIAHSLAHMCRYTGHGGRFLSVAEHCVHVAMWLLPRYGTKVALAGLLHDAPEALSGFGDVSRPAKKRAPIIKETEDRIWQAIAAAFCLSPIMPPEVHEADTRICADEMAANMHEVDPTVGEPLGIEIGFWIPGLAEAQFLELYRRLVAEIGKPKEWRVA